MDLERCRVTVPDTGDADADINARQYCDTDIDAYALCYWFMHLLWDVLGDRFQ